MDLYSRYLAIGVPAGRVFERATPAGHGVGCTGHPCVCIYGADVRARGDGLTDEEYLAQHAPAMIVTP